MQRSCSSLGVSCRKNMNSNVMGFVANPCFHLLRIEGKELGLDAQHLFLVTKDKDASIAL